MNRSDTGNGGKKQAEGKGSKDAITIEYIANVATTNCSSKKYHEYNGTEIVTASPFEALNMADNDVGVAYSCTFSS